MPDPFTGTGEIAAPVSRLIGMGRVPRVEKIRKLQPDRTIQLRGFDDLGASAALHSATRASFKVSGVFRDPADFAVLILYDADNFYEHPRLKYLPDTDFSGLTLTFDVHYSGLMPLDSPKYPTIDWPYLDVIRPDGTTAKIPLFAHAEQVGRNVHLRRSQLRHRGQRASALRPHHALVPEFRLRLHRAERARSLPTAAEVAAALAAQINSVDWEAFGTLIPLQRGGERSHASHHRRPAGRGRQHDPHVRRRQERPAADHGSPWRFSRAAARTRPGASRWTSARWASRRSARCGSPSRRRSANGAAMPDTEWEASFTNWTLAGPEAKRALPVAGPGSVRVEENDSWCGYSGDWAAESGFYSGGYARRASSVGDAVTVFYSCPSEHDLYVGTSLYSDRGVAGVRLDEDPETELDCRLSAEPAVVTRRKVRSAVSAGAAHGDASGSSRRAASTSTFWRRRCLRTCPDPLPAIARTSRPPWTTAPTTPTNSRRRASCGCSINSASPGPMNEYIGVFWWNQRKREDAVHSEL